MLTLVRVDPLRLRLDVPERESTGVRVGQAVRVFVEGDTNVYSGVIGRLSPALNEQNRMLLVEADVPAQGSLQPGRFVRGQIVVQEREPVVTVPHRAIVTFAGIEKVVRVQDGKALETTVTTGRRENDHVEVTTGLEAGEVVVLDPAGLRSGQPVQVGGGT
jgi:RND family efflux transporter MFP subunit